MIISPLLLLNVLVIFPTFYLPRQRPAAIDQLANAKSLLGKIGPFFFLLRDQNIVWLSIELFALLSLFLLFRKNFFSPFAKLSITFFIFFLTSYEIYEVIIIRFFDRSPVWFNDRLLIVDGSNLLLDLFNSYWYLLLLALAVVLVTVFYLLPKLITLAFNFFKRIESLQTLLLTLASFILMWIVITILYGHDDRLKDREGLAQSTVARIITNYKLSKQFKIDMKRILSGPIDTTYIGYNNFELKRKPNIYFFFVESYGKVLTTGPTYKSLYGERMIELQESLLNSGRHIISNYSRSPILGGGSWMSIATAIGGLEINNHTLFSKYTETPRPNMAGFFHQQGYLTFLLQPNTKSRPARPIKNQYGFDKMLLYEEMNYSGKHYGFGIVPDQYAINYSFEKYLQHSEKPVFLFFMTVSAHMPWKVVPPFVKDWKSVNKRTEEFSPEFENIKTKIKLFVNNKKEQNYLSLIFYDLLTIERFINKKLSANDVIIILGDHQPPMIGQSNNTFETPIHIISSEIEFLNLFKENGFVDGGLKSLQLNGSINHSGVFSLLVQKLVLHYSDNNSKPTLLENGASLSIMQ